MYIDTLNRARSLIEQANDDGSSVFIATISPDGNTANVKFFGDCPKMINLLTNLIKLANFRIEGAIVKEVTCEAFSQGLITIK